ncbi:ATP-binding protein [Asticcacaulis sp. AC402]|uniref:ATP-binding protein n=1 Tax=Asticcacaulis sp. AC402 TaxID=1282361 RepID=UPI0004CF3D7D|nr:ATP-binding protein [Asticcacaulis sp. AC402]
MPDSQPEAGLDSLTMLAADIFDAPIALIALCDGERYVFKARHGMPIDLIPREISFCDHTLQCGDILVVPDTLDDARYCDSPFVVDEPYVRFYAGAPIHFEGEAVGTISVIDIHPRRDFDAIDQRRLKKLAATAASILSLRKDSLARKAAIRQLQDTQNKLELMEEVAGVGYWHVDIKKQEAFWSRGVYAIHGLDRETFTPDIATAINLFHPDDREEVKRCVSDAMQNGADLHFECRLIRGDGKARIVYARGGVERDADGQPDFIFGILEDITDQSHYEETLRAARRDAEAHQQAKSDFLSNMSHEIRTPLTTILGYANLLKGVADLPRDARHYIGRINKAGEALLSLITDVLDFSKLEAGQVTLDAQPTDLRQLAGDVVDQFMALTETRNITIGFDYAAASPVWLMLDDVRIRQVLYNLIGNACKFTHDGFVAVDLMVSNGRLRVEVKDTGPGLTPEQRGRLFTRFNQVDNSINRKYGGSGLGLSICYEIVRLMAGEIGVDSEPGRGSTFWFEIPAIETEAPAPTVVPEGLRPIFLEDRKVLIVDDHPVNRELIRLLLKDYGLEIFEASDGAEALEMCSVTRFDLVFMDIQMPVLDGITATRMVCERGGSTQPGAIVALSAATQTRLLTDTRGHGFDHVLHKPIDLPQFYATLHRCLEDTNGTPIVLAC